MRLCYYLDTSAINKLHDDPCWDDAAFEALHAVADVRISALNIAEIVATPNVEHRVSLMRLVKKMSNDFRHLALPSEILRRSLDFFEKVRQADAAGQPHPNSNTNFSVEEEGTPFWLLVDDPEQARNQDIYEDVVDSNADQERRYNSWVSDLRPHLQITRKQSGDPYRTGAGLIKYFATPSGNADLEAAFQDTFSELAQDVGSNYKGNAHDVFNRLEPWSFYFGAMVHGLYSRSISNKNFGKKKNPGAIDTKQAIYLIAGNRFVTADIKSRQYRAIRIVSKLGQKERKVLKYEEFSRMFL